MIRLLSAVQGWLLPCPFWIKDKGRVGEFLVRRHFLRQGYHTLARNHIMGKGELDLIMARDREILFVEVKTRKPRPELRMDDTLSWNQERRLIFLAEQYLRRISPQPVNWQFLLVLVLLESPFRFQFHFGRLR